MLSSHTTTTFYGSFLLDCQSGMQLNLCLCSSHLQTAFKYKFW